MFLRRSSRKIGQVPGTLEHVGERKTEQVRIELLRYDAEAVAEQVAATPAELEELLRAGRRDMVSWINVTGVHDVDAIQRLGQAFSLHPLVLEDVVNTEQRPKLDDHDDYLFVVVKMLYPGGDGNAIVHEQVSLILAPGLVISLQESEFDVFGPVRERIRKGKGRIRALGADYLAYALLDVIVDHYFVVAEDLAVRLEELQGEVVRRARPDVIEEVHRLSRELILLRKSVAPLREVVGGLIKGDAALIGDEVVVYLRDVQDHVRQVLDAIDAARDLVASMVGTYASTLSNRMNEVMRVLTVIATIFIPLTFLAGIYGMNFKHMPELDWPYAYPAFWGVLLVVLILMLLFFKRRRWL